MSWIGAERKRKRIEQQPERRWEADVKLQKKELNFMRAKISLLEAELKSHYAHCNFNTSFKNQLMKSSSTADTSLFNVSPPSTSPRSPSPPHPSNPDPSPKGILRNKIPSNNNITPPVSLTKPPSNPSIEKLVREGSNPSGTSPSILSLSRCRSLVLELFIFGI